MAERGPRHPGEILAEMLLERGDPTQSETAERLGISRPRLNELLKGKRGITPDTALRLARLLGTSAEYWMAAQSAWELARGSVELAEELDRIRPLPRPGGPAKAGPDAASGGEETRYLREFLAQHGLAAAAERFAEFRSAVDRMAGRGGGG